MPPLSQKSYRLFWGPYINCNRETNSFFHRIASIHKESRSVSGSLCISARVRVYYIIVFRHAINPTAEGILAVYPPKFGRRLCEKILRIRSQIPPKFDLLTFAHTSLRLPILAKEPRGSIL